jgi:CRP-like cAMP-binding protein
VQHGENPKVDLLRSVPFFAGLSADELDAVAAAAAEANVPVGEALLSQATPSGGVVVLLDGGAAIEKDGETIGTVEPGDVVGEVGVVMRMRRTATVTTTMPSHLLVIEADAFRALLDTIPALARGAWKATNTRLEP